jgi:TatD DNase family protein
MTDAHYHRGGFDTFLVLGGEERRFFGVHPWQADDSPPDVAVLRAALESDPLAGVGEIGLDRLRSRETSAAQREAFAVQLALAAEMRRPVVLHGAKCWGEVVKACRPFAGIIPAFLFHGFSRSTGLLPEMFAMNGFVSVGPTLLNDHAVNYRTMAAALPLERVLVETDSEWDAPTAHEAQLDAVAARLAELRGMAVADLAAALELNLARFVHSPQP